MYLYYIHAPSDFPEVAIDETKIRQVMMNFIDNAVYYAKPDGGEVLIVLEKQRDAVVFSVKDNGIGVPTHVHGDIYSQSFIVQITPKKPVQTGRVSGSTWQNV
jgi:signal transduction histidine kinase